MIFKSKLFSKNNNVHHAFFSRKNGASKGIYGTLNCGLGSKDKKKYVYQKNTFLDPPIGLEIEGVFFLELAWG